MRTLLLGLMILGLTNLNAQEKTEKNNELPGVEVIATITGRNAEYITAVKTSDASVNELELKAANFDVFDLYNSMRGNKVAYQDANGNYQVSFVSKNGNIVASYDSEGKIVQTTERFKNILLPRSVFNAVGKSYPGYYIKKDVYQVKYHIDKEIMKKYKLLIKNNDSKNWINMDETGMIL